MASLIKVGQKKTDSSLRETKTNGGDEGLQQGVCGREKNFACLEFIFCSSDIKTNLLLIKRVFSCFSFIQIFRRVPGIKSQEISAASSM